MSVNSDHLQDAPEESTAETPVEQATEMPKSTMESLNEKTRARHSSISADSLKGIKTMHDVFDGYKIGDEVAFLANEPKESERLDTAQTVVETGAKASKIGKSVFETAENALGGWSNGNGIAGAAITFIGYIKSAYEIMISDASGKEKAAELGKETANAAFDMAGNIIDVIEGFGGAVLKGFKIIPGLGMVIDAIEAGIAVYKIIKADRARVRMNDSRRLFKEKYMNRPIQSEGETAGKSMVKKIGRFNIKRLWKKTDITVDEKTMKARRDELRAKPELTREEQEELKDITKFLIQDRLRRGNRNKEIKSAGTIVSKIAAITGKIAALIGTFGGSLVAESIAGGVDLALDSVDVASTVGSGIMGAYQGRGGRDKGSQYTQYLMEVIGSLPATYDAPEDKSAYAETKDMVDATGVDTGKLNKVATQAKSATSDSDKKKGKANAYKMFIKLFDG